MMDRDRGGGLDVALVSSPPDLEVRVTIAYSDSFFLSQKGPPNTENRRMPYSDNLLQLSLQNSRRG